MLIFNIIYKMINNYKKIKELLNTKQTGPIFFVTPNPNRAVGIEKEVKNYHIICSQRTDIIDYLEKEKVSVLCLDDDNIKNSGKLLGDKKVLSYIKRKSKGKMTDIITFKPSPKIARLCNNNDFKYLGNKWELNRKLEDKVEFVKITKKLRIPNAKSEIKKIENNEKFQGLFNLKEKYVIQLQRGYSGNSTFLIKNKTDLDKIIKKYKGRKVKISKYIKGDTYTVNVHVGELGIIISQPIFQITGLVDYNKNELGTCGNDYMYGEKLKSKEKKKIFNYTKKVGSYMKKIGYRGIFGLDFIVSGDNADLIEINPRFVGSIPVFTKLQIQRKQVPFLFLHLAEFFDISCRSEPLPFDFSFVKWNKEKSFNFSQLILRNTNENRVKIVKSMTSGIYKIKKDKLILKEKTYYAKDLKENEFLIQTVKKGSLINSDMEYTNIQVGYGIMKNDRQFKFCFDRIIHLVLKNIKIKI
ncbi:ATP-grasp domain-containing protein [Candidatus Parcubacteria bacterium]|nr:ATP-grasp domain-containing protein [Candidatus Parcubacteria bacterium]